MRYIIIGNLDGKSPLIIEYYPSEKPGMIDSDIMHIFRPSTKIRIISRRELPIKEINGILKETGYSGAC